MFERNGEFIPEDELLKMESGKEDLEYRVDLIKLRKQLVNLIRSSNVSLDDNSDVTLADFDLFYAEFFEGKNI